jgi:(E)-4-hydroxy-3-methylbut-2-enyl-diphosphate synthase
MIKRRETYTFKIGSKIIGSRAPILVQSMCKTPTRNLPKLVREIKQLEKAGCEMVRIALPDLETCQLIPFLKKQIQIPLIGDVHFDHRIALEAIKQGIDKIRINPGNIKDKQKIKQIIQLAQERKIPLRVGVNTGSIFKLRTKITPTALVETTLNYLKLFEDAGFYRVVVSIKSFEIPLMVESYKLLAEKVKYPFHLGVTEAGSGREGVVRSVLGIGCLLLQGIGDTIRVSLTESSLEEVKVGFEILKSLGLREKGPVVISCPTCGRCQIDLFKILAEVKRKLKKFSLPLKVAIMGCVVNGPGEASQADFGIAGGKKFGVLFKKGHPVRKIREDKLVEELMKEIKKMTI